MNQKEDESKTGWVVKRHEPRKKAEKVFVPAGPWPGSEAASGAGRQRGRGWPAGALWGPPRGGLHTKRTSRSTAPEQILDLSH